MKRCPYCGQEYSDEYSVCAIDENPLEFCNPKPPAPPSKPVESEEPAPPPAGPVDLSWKAVATGGAGDKDASTPEGFGFLGRFNPAEAEHLLEKFAAAGVRFKISNVEGRVFTTGDIVSGAGYVTRNVIEVFVYSDDEEKAAKIYTADWKV